MDDQMAIHDFLNILDLARLKAWILYKDATGQQFEVNIFLISINQ